MHVLAGLDIRAVEDAVVHRLVGWAALEIIRVAGVGALASAFHGAAWKLACVPEGCAVEVLLVLRGLAGSAGEIEAVAEGSALARGEVGDAD